AQFAKLQSREPGTSTSGFNERAAIRQDFCRLGRFFRTGEVAAPKKVETHWRAAGVSRLVGVRASPQRGLRHLLLVNRAGERPRLPRPPGDLRPPLATVNNGLRASGKPTNPGADALGSPGRANQRSGFGTRLLRRPLPRSRAPLRPAAAAAEARDSAAD